LQKENIDMNFGSDIEQFYQLVRQDSELQEQLKNAKDVDDFVVIATNLANKNGYDLSPEQVKSFIVQEQGTDTELSDELLLSVAGGKGDDDDQAFMPTGTPDYGTCSDIVG
jgi:predicted ribosomally synthesized peptide with nif11-like leader